MASWKNVSGLEAWSVPSSFSGTWFPDAYARDTDALTKALQKSISGQEPDPDTVLIPTSSSSSSYTNHVIQHESVPTSSSEHETATKRLRYPIPSGKISKLKSRGSKRTPTTFIKADPANFRQMVQQVTGIQFADPHVLMPRPVLKPEPQRAVNRFQGGLSTLDTSAFLLDQHQVVVGPAPQTATKLSFAPECAGLDSGAFPIFPTLESWQPM